MGLISCEDFLTREPISKIGSGEYFQDESSLLTYTNGFLESYTPSFATLGYGDGYSDIIATRASTEFLTTTSWTPAQQGSWAKSNWKPIYNINYFLLHMREVKGISEEALNHYEGTGRFWRAWQYFSKVKTFGAVPWYDAPIDAEDEAQLYKPRDSREYVMDKVLEDLDFACKHCYASNDWLGSARINRYIALAFKARVCLFEGTYRKYHATDPSTGRAWQDAGASERFLRACADACEELMAAGIYSIPNNPANVQTQYRSLFTQEKLDRTEIIWGRETSTDLLKFHDLTWRYTSSTYGQRWSLDQDFVNTYLNLDGSRYTESNSAYKTTEFTKEIQNRDYRLRQCIIVPGYSKLVAGTPTQTAPDFSLTLTGYQVIKFNLDDKSYESSSTSYNSLPIIRYAEVLLNYAEAKAELGEFDQAVWDRTIKPLRERAGVNGKRPTTADAYLKEYYGISDCDLLEIRRERAIELLLENLRYDDLMRWHLGDLLNKQWYGIYIPALDAAYDLNGDGINDICVIPAGSAPGNENGVTYIELGSTYELENGTSGRLLYNLTRNFEDKRYLRPVPKTALDINPALGQNYYWQ